MHRKTITTLPGFDAERDRWTALFAADPQAHVFLSFAWLRTYLPQVEHPWQLIELEQDGLLVAALPLLIRPLPHRRLPVARELTFASNPLGDYQGMLCRPGHEAAAAAAFAAAIGDLRWDRAGFADVSDPRFADVVARLGEAGAVVHEDPATRCYAIDLPPDFEGFVAGLRPKVRRSLVRSMKVLAERLPALRITRAGDDDIGAHVDAIVGLNTARWSGSSLRAARLRALLRDAYGAGFAHVHLVWDGPRPIAGAAIFIEPVHRTYSTYLVARDREYDHFSLGKAVLSLIVRDAIEQGCAVFDFLRGSQDYKQEYATRDKVNRHYRLARPGLRETLLRAVLPAFGVAKAAALRIVYRPRSA